MVVIDTQQCIGCKKCVQDCFPVAIKIDENKAQVNHQQCIGCGHCVAVCPQMAVSFSDFNMSEIVDANVNASIDADVYLNHLKLRRSIRRFREEALPKDILDKIIEAGRYSPTGSNLQDVSYFVSIADIQGFKRLLHEELAALADKMDPNDRAVQTYARLWKYMSKRFATTGEDRLFFNAPVVIVISALSPQSAMIAAAHMETMIYSLGLGMLYSGFTTRAICYSEKLQEYVKLKDGKQAYATLVVGYPDVTYLRSVPRHDADVIWE